MMEKEIASGIRASATTNPASTSVRSSFGERRALRTVGARGTEPVIGAGKVLLKDRAPFRRSDHACPTDVNTGPGMVMRIKSHP